MTEDYASVKQIQFMQKLGFPPQPTTLTKAQARVMIDDKLKEQEREDEPEHKHPPAQTPAPGNAAKEYHLTPEKIAHNTAIIKCRALESAIEYGGTHLDRSEDESLKIADKFVEWIYK
ncbi:hypothetical protein LCGC14_1749580 [marine sediment metagenome]|uniref:Uncharacterized protein n=1 Tax=marine sediment metagenome TaxID=412755 RepID=A0A0F9K3S6_9ZZZZ